MSAAERPKKGVSIATLNGGKDYIIRLEYDHSEQRQSVLLNGVLTSSFLCPPGKAARHHFRAADQFSGDYYSEYRTFFGTEPETMRICYAIHRRATGGDDTKWYWVDGNMKPDQWETWDKTASWYEPDDSDDNEQAAKQTRLRAEEIDAKRDAARRWLDEQRAREEHEADDAPAP